MSRALLTAVATALVMLASCGTREQGELDETTLAEIRTMLDARKCGRNMDDLMFTIVYAVLGYESDSTAVYEVPAGTQDSLLACPVSGLSYEVLVDSAGVRITCPSGHGMLEEEYP